MSSHLQVFYIWNTLKKVTTEEFIFMSYNKVLYSFYLGQRIKEDRELISPTIIGPKMHRGFQLILNLKRISKIVQ